MQRRYLTQPPDGGCAVMRHRCSRHAADASYSSHGGPGTAGAADQRVAYGRALRAAAALRTHHLMRPSGSGIMQSCTRIMRTLAAVSPDWPRSAGGSLRELMFPGGAAGADAGGGRAIHGGSGSEGPRHGGGGTAAAQRCRPFVPVRLSRCRVALSSRIRSESLHSRKKRV